MMVVEKKIEVDNKANFPVVCLKSGREDEVKQMGH